MYTDRPIKVKLISTAIPTLLPHKQLSTARKTIRKNEIKLWNRVWIYISTWHYSNFFMLL